MHAKSADWTKGQALGPLPLNSVIFRPTRGEVLQAGSISVQGYAIATEGKHLERVELSGDGGTTWSTARLQESPQPGAWCFWEATMPLDPGMHHLAVRAWDSSGSAQPEDIRQVWNWKGYLNNAWHRINIAVQ